MYKYQYSAFACRDICDMHSVPVGGFIESHNQLTDTEVKMMAYADHPQFVLFRDFECKEIF